GDAGVEPAIELAARLRLVGRLDDDVGGRRAELEAGDDHRLVLQVVVDVDEPPLGDVDEVADPVGAAGDRETVELLRPAIAGCTTTGASPALVYHRGLAATDRSGPPKGMRSMSHGLPAVLIEAVLTRSAPSPRPSAT